MKKTLFIVSMAFTSCFYLAVNGQTDPGSDNLKHVWDFNDEYDESPDDAVDGELVGDAAVSDGALDLTANDGTQTDYSGSFFVLDGEALALNTYEELSIHTWLSATNAPWNSMLFYFGDSTGGVGAKGVFATSVSRAAISTYSPGSPWSGESNAAPADADYSTDGGLDHHVVVTIDADSITYFLDGAFMANAPMELADGTNSIADIGTQCAWIGRGGYQADPAWGGTIYQFAIYDKKLSNDEVKFLYDLGKDVIPQFPTNVKNVSSIASQHNVFVKNDYINISSKLAKPAKLEITVYDVSGKTVTQKVSNGSVGTNLTVLDVNLNQGIFFVKISQNGETASYKIVK